VPPYRAEASDDGSQQSIARKGRAKQAQSERDMEARNAKRSAHFKKTGKWEYDVSKVSD
jgi:hypothetical protein